LVVQQIGLREAPRGENRLSPEKLYKCIPFSADYWRYIAQERAIRFASIPELLNGNDKEEFDHRWETKSQFFLKFRGSLKPYFESLFSRTVILSMSKSPSERCWKEYCSNGGLRYEFEYDGTHFKTSDVNCMSVVYNDNKTFNLPEFIIRQEPDPTIKHLLKVEHGLSRPDWIRLWIWLQLGSPNRNSLDYIQNELAFKKIAQFKYEDEYRFVHLTEKIGSRPLKLNLNSQKAGLQNLGLKLVQISTSDTEPVRRELSGCGVEIGDVYFR